MICRFAIVVFLASFAYPAKAIPFPYSCVRNFYVAPNGIDAPGRGVQSAPWATPWYADNQGLQGGDCVRVQAGVYYSYGTWTINHGGYANKADGFVSYIGQDAIIRPTQGIPAYFLVNVASNYVNVKGFEFDGHGVNDCAVSVQYHHHVNFYNNFVHDSDGGGICTDSADYTDVIGNYVTRTLYRSHWHESGIDILSPKTIAASALPWDNQRFRIKVIGNISSNNIIGPDIQNSSDGQGIIIDQAYYYNYTSPILIQSNLSVGNGASGILSFLSRNVIIDHNTSYGNNLDSRTHTRGDIISENSDEVWIVNNIAQTTNGNNFALSILQWKIPQFPSPVTHYDVYLANNLTWDGTQGHKSVQINGDDLGAVSLHDYGGLYGTNPQFVNAPNDFHLRVSSPARGKGQNSVPDYPLYSLDGGLMTLPSNLGAY